MKKSILALPVLFKLVLAISVLSLSACTASAPKPVKESRFMLNTIVEITLYEKNSTSRDMLEVMFNEIQNSENKYSRHISGSEISNINNHPGKSVAVTDDTMEIVEKSLYFSSLSNGLFDISIGPLVDLWDINGDNPHVPTNYEINAVLERVDYRKIAIDKQNNTVTIDSGMSLDVGAIAKGYITDRLVSYLRQKGVGSALLNLGGNLYLHGSKTDGSAWNIGIRDPFGLQGEYIGLVSVRDMSVVTSGIYERSFEENQKVYHHILNPETGYPEDNELASVSIITPSSTLADGFSTTVFLLGPKDGMDLISRLEDVEAIMVTRDKRIYLSPGIKNGEIPFELMDHEFTVSELQ